MTAATLRKQKCELVICLSHLGFEYKDATKVSDRKLAQNSENIDIILGGHTHTFMEKPAIEKKKRSQNVIINQVGWAGLQLGRIDIELSKKSIDNQNIVID